MLSANRPSAWRSRRRTSIISIAPFRFPRRSWLRNERYLAIDAASDWRRRRCCSENSAADSRRERSRAAWRRAASSVPSSRPSSAARAPGSDSRKNWYSSMTWSRSSCWSSRWTACFRAFSVSRLTAGCPSLMTRASCSSSSGRESSRWLCGRARNSGTSSRSRRRAWFRTVGRIRRRASPVST